MTVHLSFDASGSASLARLSDVGNAPIGMFDSGVGGLTVVAALARRRPAERVLYLADQGHVPYGGRDLDEIRGFARGITAMLARQRVKAVVMACNISSATTWPEIAGMYGEQRAFGMVVPGATTAVAASKVGCVGVLATAGTVASGAYTAAIHRLDPSLRVVEVPCPKFVPLVESGDTHGAAAYAAAREYLEPIEAAGCDTVVLGCTHYPYLLDALRGVARSSVHFVDPAEAVADALVSALDGQDLAATGPTGPHRLLTTGDPVHFAQQVPRFLPGDPAEIEAATWTATAA